MLRIDAARVRFALVTILLTLIIFLCGCSPVRVALPAGHEPAPPTTLASTPEDV